MVLTFCSLQIRTFCKSVVYCIQMDNEDLMKVFVSESLNAPKDIAAFVPKTAQDILSEREVDALHSVTKHCEDDHSTSDSMSMKVCCGDSKTEAHVTVDGENECFSVSETLNSTDQFDIEQNALNVLPVGENLAHLPSGTLDVIRQLAQLPGGLQLVSFENGTVAWLVTPQLMSADTSTTADQLELDAIDIPTEASLVIGNNEDQVDPVITELSKSVNDDAKTSSTDLAENADSASEALFQSSSALLRKLLSRPQSIIKHLSTAAGPGEKTFRCTIDGCGRHYTTQHHLKVHQRTHTGDRPFVCDFDSCCKAFSTNYGLKSHRRVHTGEKPYVCSFDGCDKAFKTSGDLQKHTRTHTGVKPFMCPFEDCKRSFTTSNIRKVHIRTHTGERPYVCDVPSCGKTFASATNYKNHIRIHSGEKPYVCTWDGCGRRFTEYSSLYKHHVVHSPHKPYECADCGKTYRQTSTLAMHRRMVHSDGHDMDAAATNLVQAATAFLVASSNGDVHSPPMLSIQMVDDRGSIGEDAEEKLVIDTSDRQHQLLNPSEGLHIDVPLDMVAMTLSSLATDTHANQEAHGRNGSQVCFITAAGLAGVPSTNY